MEKITVEELLYFYYRIIYNPFFLTKQNRSKQRTSIEREVQIFTSFTLNSNLANESATLLNSLETCWKITFQFCCIKILASVRYSTQEWSLIWENHCGWGHWWGLNIRTCTRVHAPTCEANIRPWITFRSSAIPLWIPYYNFHQYLILTIQLWVLSILHGSESTKWHHQQDHESTGPNFSTHHHVIPPSPCPPQMMKEPFRFIVSNDCSFKKKVSNQSQLFRVKNKGKRS